MLYSHLVLCWFCWFDLILYVPSTIFQLNRDGSSWVGPVLCWDKCVLLNDHKAVTPVRLEPAAPQSRAKHSTLSHCAPRYCVGMVYVTSASCYVTSVLRYQSRSSMFIRGLIPMNSTELAEAVPFSLIQVDCEKKSHLYSHSICATHCY